MIARPKSRAAKSTKGRGSSRHAPGDKRQEKRMQVNAQRRAILGGIGATAMLPLMGSSGSFAATVGASGQEMVETASGKVRGSRDGKVFIFRGIPYGAHTGGPARFMPPRKPEIGRASGREKGGTDG